ncbi:GNAT family N-acetyltransferase [Alkaliphilus peptidifermentans]|uniref:Acetyltransferase (GNAT) domain-containing protein n=1 Tax=Alkaliphilus peptidifermentans DSM 18978 TaxID=1120976 RepID=A0A1G5GCM9_9FIRM|nr:GNAT family N-acetyltransferase [Alkaliphilus peptidifermentans]SCY49107.1 Acetyltransferase (GNAT) domain-containing protein [Alkaliphilus peptidifermentans DSM 18978]
MSLVREYKIGDENQILELFNSTFNMNRSMEHWYWKFRDNPFNTSIIALAEEDKHIIGQCTLLPSLMKIGDHNIMGGQSIDAMIHKNHRRRGYYEKLSLYSYELGMERNIPFRYSFPSPSTLEGIIRKLGGTLVCNIPVYIQIYNVNSFASIFIKNQGLARLLSQPLTAFLKIIKRSKIKKRLTYDIKKVNEFDSSFDELWDKYKDMYSNLSIRSSNYLNWRIRNHPDIEYQVFSATENNLKGYIVLKIEEKKVKGKYLMKVGTIVDLVALDIETIDQLLYQATEYFNENKVDFASAWGLDHMSHTKELKKAGFIKSRGCIPFAVKSFDEKLSQELYKKNNWYLMPIETDTY